MLMIVIACLLVMTASGAFVCYLSMRAPEGHEDQNGFHFAPESKPAEKTETPRAVTAIKAHDDHEPIAA